MKKLFLITWFIPVICFSQQPAFRFFAEIKADTVSRVIVISSENYAETLLGGDWVETFVNDPTKNYAGIGSIYYPERHNFSSRKPYPSWHLDEQCNWQSPIVYPVDGRVYIWNEELKIWEAIQ